MTPKEKAEELSDKYWNLNYDWDGVTKGKWANDGALIAVDEILWLDSIDKDYWYQVKQEIKNLND